MPEQRGLPARIAARALLAPLAFYKFAISPLLGTNCRHLPTCSDYAREAIAVNGPWRGAWLALARICRCHPLGSHGHDPVPDNSRERHGFAPWRYGRWRLSSAAPATAEAVTEHPAKQIS